MYVMRGIRPVYRRERYVEHRTRILPSTFYDGITVTGCPGKPERKIVMNTPRFEKPSRPHRHLTSSIMAITLAACCLVGTAASETHGSTASNGLRMSGLISRQAAIQGAAMGDAILLFSWDATKIPA